MLPFDPASPERTALVQGERRLSYAQLGNAIDRLAGRLIELGFRPLDRVVFQLPNSIEFVITFFALLRIGVIPVLALPAHRRDEISHFVAHAEAVGYVVPDIWRDYDYRSLAAEMSAGAPSLRHVLVLGEPGANQISLTDLLAAITAMRTKLALGDFAPSPDEVALMLLSGGTTGLPKMIPRTHNDYVYNCRQSGAVAGFNPNNRISGVAADGAQLHARLSRRARCTGLGRHDSNRTGCDIRHRRAIDRSRAGVGHFRRCAADRQLAERRSPADRDLLRLCVC